MMTVLPKLFIMCQVETMRCVQGAENLIRNTEHRFEDTIDNITYKQRTTTERSTLETNVQSCIDFPKPSAENLNILLHHSFKGQQPSYFHTELKFKLKPGKMALIFLRTTPSYKINYMVLIGIILRQLFIQL
jgi:hypothetical protein